MFQDQEDIKEHKFEIGMKLEAVNPKNRSQIGPATVSEIINKFYVRVTMDNLEAKTEQEKVNKFYLTIRFQLAFSC